MIPKPPFGQDLSPEQEIAEFERLKPRLRDLWSALSAREEEPYTSVVIPSLTLDQSELAKLEAASFYEERLLFLLIRLRNPQAHMVYVTSQPIHPLILEYYFQLLVGIPASHARARLTLLCANDASPRSLTEKILARPRLIQRIRYGMPDPSRAFMTVFNSTKLERKLAVLLGIPLNGVDPALAPLGTKSGSRRVFREAGVRLAEGFEDLHSGDDVVAALDELKKRRPGLRRAVLKLDDSFSGEGNAIFRYPKNSWRGTIGKAMSELTFSVPTNFDRYRRKFSRWAASSKSSSNTPTRLRRACSFASIRRAKSCFCRRTTRFSVAHRATSTRDAGSRPRRHTVGRFRMRVGESARSSPGKGWSVVSASTSSWAADPARSNGTSLPSRSTSESAGRRTHFSLSSF